jgi:hypothetical protein
MEMVTLVILEGNVIDLMLSRFVPLNLYELCKTLVHLSNKCASVFFKLLCRIKTQIMLF